MLNPVSSLSDFFQPNSSEKLSTSDAYRGRVLIFSSLIAGLFVSSFWIMRMIVEDYSGAPLYTLQITTFVLFTAPFVFKYTGSIDFAGVFVNLLCTTGLSVFTFYDGGFYSSALAWFPVLPLFAVFLSGKRYGLIIAGVLFVNLFILLVLHRQNLVTEIPVDYQQMNTLYFWSISSVFVLMLAVAILYLDWQTKIHESLKAANEAKNDFLSGVSHELRTPLNSILGFAEILGKEYAGELNEKQSTYVSHIESSGSHLLSLINDLLDISKLDSGVLTLQQDDVNTQSLVMEVYDLLHHRANEKNINLSVNTGSIKNYEVVILDKRIMKQVLINLVTNAIKFTPEDGRVDLSISTSNHEIIFSVSDSGEGIAEELHEKVFERFYQIHSHNDNKDPGVGLGLAISRDLIELHGGSLSIAKSDDELDNNGSCFICKIPLNLPQSQLDKSDH